MHADDHGDKAQAGLSRLVGGKRVLTSGESLLEIAVCRAARRVCVPARDVSSSGGLTRLDLQDCVAIPPIEVLEDDVRLVSQPWESLHK